MENKRLKNKLLFYRTQNGFRFGKAFAEHLGVERTLYYKWEKGVFPPDLYHALLISQKLGVSVNEIWELED
ncbi:MAG: hypothetical protein JM58_09390 [Peptococcaceae bacterium BICA1-8]|nr:MAG: hypothetical protein JM58_09390 [Peptococcaceae bacterium BICA1-8]